MHPIRIFLLTSLILLTPIFVNAQGYGCEEELFPRKDKSTRLYGYVNALSEYRVPPSFLRAKPFIGKYAIVQQGKQFGVINCDGVLVIPAEYEEITSFFDGKGWVKKNGLYGLISEQGRMLIQPMYEGIKEMNIYSGSATWVKKAGLWGLISRETGRMLLNPIYDDVSPISDSAAIGRGASSQDLIYTGDGRVIIKGMRSVSKVAAGLFVYESTDRKYGTFNSLAFIIQRPEYESIKLNNNYLQTRRNGKSGLRTLRNGIILDEVFDSISPARGGFFSVQRGDSNQIFDSRGKRNLPPGKYGLAHVLNPEFALVSQGGKTGFWSPVKRKWIMPLEEMKARVASGNDWLSISRPGKGKALQDAADAPLSSAEWDSLNTSDPASFVRAYKGSKVFLISSRNPLPGKGYEEILPLGGGYFACREGDRFGLIKGLTELLIPIEYASIRKLITGNGILFLASKDGRSFLLSESGKVVHKGDFEQIMPASSKLFTAAAGGKWGISRSDGSWLIENRFDSLQVIFRLADECRFPIAFYRRGKAVLINEAGKEITEALPCRWLDGGEGALFCKKDGSFQLFDATGKQQGDLMLQDFRPFEEGNAMVKSNGLWGFINHSGRMVIQAKYQELLPFKNGIAYARENNLWGVLRKNGSWLVKPSGISVVTDADGKRKLLLP